MKVSNIEVKLIDYCGSDLSVVNAARVSFHKESTELQEKDDKLINYLAKHKHKSPFNHSFITFRVKAPIFVARQLVKHKFMPWNEVSRRYVDDEPEFYFPKEYRKKAENVKQGSSNETVYNLDENFSIKDVMELDTTFSLKRYLQLLDTGMCAEQARMFLPQNMMTEWIWSGTLGAWADMLILRLDSHTQSETRDVAELIKPEIEKLFPISLKALLENK